MPGLRWDRIVRTAGPAEVAAASSIRLNLEDDPALVPLETLPGLDHYRVPPGEEHPRGLVDRLTNERSPLRLELRCEIAALHGKRWFRPAQGSLGSQVL